MTPAEKAFWRLLRDRQFEHWKFRRQTQIGPWTVDFCCYELKLVIELDGGIHRLTEDRDAERMQTSIIAASRSCASTTVRR